MNSEILWFSESSVVHRQGHVHDDAVRVVEGGVRHERQPESRRQRARRGAAGYPGAYFFEIAFFLMFC